MKRKIIVFMSMLFCGAIHVAHSFDQIPSYSIDNESLFKENVNEKLWMHENSPEFISPELRASIPDDIPDDFLICPICGSSLNRSTGACTNFTCNYVYGDGDGTGTETLPVGDTAWSAFLVFLIVYIVIYRRKFMRKIIN